MTFEQKPYRLTLPILWKLAFPLVFPEQLINF